MSTRRSVGAVVGRSGDRSLSMRDAVIEADAARDEATPDELGPGLDLEPEAYRSEETEPDFDLEDEPEVEAEPEPQVKLKRKRNHLIPIDYFSALDDILARSYTKQEAAFRMSQAFNRMMESRGIEAEFDSSMFEKAATNMAIVAQIREMAWLFGLGPDFADRIAEHTIDRLFSPGYTQAPKVRKTE